MATVSGIFWARLKWVSLIDTFPSLVSSAFQPSMLSASTRGLYCKEIVIIIQFRLMLYWVLRETVSTPVFRRIFFAVLGRSSTSWSATAFLTHWLTLRLYNRRDELDYLSPFNVYHMLYGGYCNVHHLIEWLDELKDRRQVERFTKSWFICRPTYQTFQ